MLEKLIYPSRFPAASLTANPDTRTRFERKQSGHSFSFGLGRAYPIQLLNKLIQSSAEPFRKDKFTNEAIMIVYTINI